MLKDETVWLPQKLMATLFDVSVPTISEHLSNVFQQGELALESTVRKFRTVQQEGNRQKSPGNMQKVNLRNIELFRTNFLKATLIGK